jgi:hypothetical protein
MKGASNTKVRDKRIGFLSEKLKEIESLKNLGVDGRTLNGPW